MERQAGATLRGSIMGPRGDGRGRRQGSEWGGVRRSNIL